MTVTPTIVSPQRQRDPLTALGTTLAFLAQLDIALAEARARHYPLAILQLDIDGFAMLNERRGGEFADGVLAELAASLREQAAQHAGSVATTVTAEAFRVGGDEFVLLLPATGRLRARRTAAALLAEAARDRVSLSIGIGIVEPGQIDLGLLLLSADGALRAVKARGGGQARLLTQAPPDAVGARGVVEWLSRHTIDATRQLDSASQLALTDPVTGLPNQRALDQFLQTEVPRVRRHGRPFSLLLIDGDNLKAFNEQLGYAAGDAWIVRLGEVLVRETRGSDLTVRWRTGDEFVIAMPETPREAALLVAERIRVAVERESGTLPLPVSVSIGVATFPDDAAGVEDLLARVEAANLLAKSLGKNRVVSVESPLTGPPGATSREG